MFRRGITVLCWLLLVGPSIAWAQQTTVEGTIFDAETEEGLPGANVLIVEENLGTATDINGRFEIDNVPNGEYTLRVTFVGYRALEETITVRAGMADLEFTLEPDFTGLEEVVVTGAASATSKARAEVSVSRVNAEELLENNSYQDVSQLLTGKVAGVTVQPASGNVGGGIRFVMRSSTGLNGNGQPLIIVDGVRIDNAQVAGFGAGGQGVSMLNNLNPEDIESVDILKGPAGAALYGTSGSNGVVLISTKRGSLAGGADRPFTVTYKGTVGANQQADEYTRSNAGVPETANAFFRDGQIIGHNLAVQGGSDLVRYFASYDLRDEEGHINNNQQDRQSFRANFEAFPIEGVTLRANTGYTLNELDRPQNDNNIFGYLGNTLLSTNPFNFTDSLAIEGLQNRSRINRFIGSAEAEWRPITGLQLRAVIGYDGTEMRNDETLPQNLSFAGVVNGERNIFQRTNQQYTYEATGRYAYNITDQISATTTAGFQAFNRVFRSFRTTKQNFSTQLATDIAGGADFINSAEDFINSREAGVFLQQELSYEDLLFVTLGLRREFASTIGDEAPSIYYPKASLAFRVDQLDVLPSAVNFLKLRAAYGESGQLPIETDGVRLLWGAEPSGFGSGAVLAIIGNVDIEPERIREIEFGLETEILNNIGLESTVYFQRANESIVDFENVPSSGRTATDVPFNVGESRGWGIETSLSAAPVRTRDYGLDFTLIWNYQENEVRDLGGAQPIFDGFDINVITEGLPRDAFFTWGSRATFNEDGTYAGAELTTTDADGDGEVDRTSFGIPYPEHNGSFSMNFRFLRDFNVSVLADWQLGLSVFNNTAVFQTLFGSNLDRNLARYQIGLTETCPLDDCANLEIFQPGTDQYRDAAETVASTETSVGGISTDGNYVEEADFIRLREISFRYDMTRLVRQFTDSRVRNLAFTVSARNLWLSTLYSGADPEVNFNGARSASKGTDFLTLPSPRTISGTLSVTF
ncbi:MAG: TonB-dependent receptor [Bacteroidota bacterium]